MNVKLWLGFALLLSVISHNLYPMAAGSPAERYSINLLWICKKFDENQSYIYPAASYASACCDFFDIIFAWAEKNPASVVHVWYDSKYVSFIAVNNTKDVINAYVKTHPGLAPICLRDIRELPLVKEYADIFSEEIPLFFRVDLLRPIIAHHAIIDEKYTAFVYQDLDMSPLSKDELFDPDTLSKLAADGIVMADDAEIVYENGFMIVSKNDKLLEVFKLAVIDLNICRAYHYLRGEFEGALAEVVYLSYPGMMAYFWLLENRVLLTVRATGEAIDATNCQCILGLNRVHPFNAIKIDFLPGFKPYCACKEHARGLIPTKKVTLKRRRVLDYGADEASRAPDIDYY